MRYLLLLSLFLCPISGFAQFSRTDISDLKADLSNYAKSNCEEVRYLKSAQAIISRISAPISNSMTPEQEQANNQLRDALGGVREGFMASMLGNKSSCRQKLIEGIKSLDSLPIQKENTHPPLIKKNSPGIST